MNGVIVLCESDRVGWERRLGSEGEAQRAFLSAWAVFLA